MGWHDSRVRGRTPSESGSRWLELPPHFWYGDRFWPTLQHASAMVWSQGSEPRRWDGSPGLWSAICYEGRPQDYSGRRWRSFEQSLPKHALRSAGPRYGCRKAHVPANFFESNPKLAHSAGSPWSARSGLNDHVDELWDSNVHAIRSILWQCRGCRCQLQEHA